MIRNTPTNKTLPSVKADMAKRIMGGKLLTSPPHTPRQKSEHGGNLVWGSKHGAKAKQMTDRKDKSFKSGAMGQQQGQTGKGQNKVGGGWEISQS
jgi:hypothetical protein